MTNRREFLQIGIAAGAWPLASRAARATGAATAHGVPLYKVVYDSRFEDSVAFARRARDLGLPAHEIQGDITSFWYHELDRRWRGGERPGAPVAIAGLTAHGAFFCLERLAWDQRMRAVFRGEHVPTADGTLEHRLSGPLAMLEAALPLDASREDWSARMAEVVAQCPRGRTEIKSARVTAPAARPSCAETLYSWVIAPARA
ncbi:MAG TPA: hypothetical protein VFV10_04375 [Gammaproteobacteria bacterium]|nr:hypothetical protein [Gammaproteobacteria bacterium]